MFFVCPSDKRGGSRAGLIQGKIYYAKAQRLPSAPKWFERTGINEES